MRRLALLLTGFMLATQLSAAGAQELSSTAMVDFLAQCIGTDGSGRPALATGPTARCPGRGPGTVSDTLPWRKHDWPARDDAAAVRLGHQASDSVVDPSFTLPVVVQTFDFGGDDARRFTRLDRPGGDGGDAAAVADGAAWIFFTEDGGGGQQWFVAESCQTDTRPQARIESWLLFGADVVRGAWRDRLARLIITRSLAECPSRFSNAYTRYRRETLDVPFRIVDGVSPVTTRRAAVDTIVSEHYGGRSVEAANHLERFFLGRGLGKFRWERWEELSKSTLPDNESRARDLAASGRCPALPYSEPPGPGWAMVDCRTWTNLVRQAEPFTVARYGWPGALIDAVGRRAR